MTTNLTKRYILSLLCFLAIVSCESAPPQEIGEGITGWLKTQAIPLKSVVAEQGFDDLEPMKKVLKDVRVVGLGESTHGTREFFQFKHRMIEFLVKEMDFTVFAIEASYPACLNINAYVLHGTGDRATALASQGFWTWDTEEVSEMIEWMRIYNQTVPEDKKVRFFGFDIQQSKQAINVVLDYLRVVAPTKVAQADNIFQPLRLIWKKYKRVKPPQPKAQLLDELQNLIGFLILNKGSFVQKTSQEEFENALQHTRILAQFMDQLNKGSFNIASWEKRDAYMADNIQYILNREKPGTKMIIWAHNGHLAADYLDTRHTMGTHLRSTFGDAYYALGFSFNQGSFQAREALENGTGPLKAFTVGAAPKESIEYQFAQAGIDNFIIDFRHSPKNPATQNWLKRSNKMRSIGALFSQRSEKWLMPINLKKHFDGMVFIENTSRARPTLTGTRQDSFLKK